MGEGESLRVRGSYEFQPGTEGEGDLLEDGQVLYNYYSSWIRHIGVATEVC
jgi:hypothetical protein